MFAGFYRRWFKQKFFNRLLLTYTVIIVTTIFFLSFTIIQNIRMSAERDAQNSVNQAVLSMHSTLGRKVDLVKMLLKQLYINPVQNEDMMSFLTNRIESFEIEDYAGAKLIRNYLDAAAAQDNDILDASLFKKNDENVYAISNLFLMDKNDFAEQNKRRFEEMGDQFYGISVTPTYTLKYDFSKTFDVFTIAANVRGVFGNPSVAASSNNFNRSIAILSINFDTDKMVAEFNKLKFGNYKADIVVLLPDGNVLLDTSKRHYGRIDPEFERMKYTQDMIMLDEDSMITSKAARTPEYYVVGILPRSQITEKTSATINTVIAIAVMSVIIALISGFISIRLFSRRIQMIHKAIRKVQFGDLTYRIPIDTSNDEISNIASSLNQMSTMLTGYIDKVYVSNLRQKDAEIYALQAQINPHFLYNMLEIIRMEALSTGSRHVSQMIEILSQMFRNSIKGGVIVGIHQELELCKKYLELHSLRYEKGLNVEFEIDPSIMEYSIPKHILQPVVENALIHGIRPDQEDNQLIIKGMLRGSDIVIEIEDNGSGIEVDKLLAIQSELSRYDIKDSGSLGLLNVHQRLRLFYGPEYGMQIHNNTHKGVTITLRLPAKTKEEMREVVQNTAR
jgi:two-component system sensor histidine kinase YesM